MLRMSARMASLSTGVLKKGGHVGPSVGGAVVFQLHQDSTHEFCTRITFDGMGHPCPASDEFATHYNRPHTAQGCAAGASLQRRSCGRDIPVGSGHGELGARLASVVLEGKDFHISPEPTSAISVSEPPLVGGSHARRMHCREVRYRLTGTPVNVHGGHCRWCQRETGTAHAHALNAGFIEAAIIILAVFNVAGGASARMGSIGIIGGPSAVVQ
jgi:hypothetical protein